MKEISLFLDVFDLVEGNEEQVNSQFSRSVLDNPAVKYETQVPQLEYMCLIMENMVLTRRPKATIYAGFQKLSRAVDPVLERFFAMADFAEKVYIIGENDKDMAQHPNVEYIHLPANHPLLREWFLVIDAPNMKMMMVAYDTEGFGTHEIEENRKFRGVKTNSPAIVDKASALLRSAIPVKS